MTDKKTMEDWFLRGGKRPEKDGTRQASRNLVCQNCGGENIPDEEYCTHCGAALTGGASTGEYCGSEHGENPCDECDGRTRCDDCPHNCGDDNDGSEVRKFVVTMTRIKTVAQEARVTVVAESEEEAMDRAEDAACEESDGWSWTDCPFTDEYEDCQAADAEEV